MLLRDIKANLVLQNFKNRSFYYLLLFLIIVCQ